MNKPIIRRIAPNAIRITHLSQGQSEPTERPWFKDVMIDDDFQQQSGPLIEAKISNNLVNIFDPAGRCFFAEAKEPVLGIKKNRPYFYFDIPQTAFFGGFHKVRNGISICLKTKHGESFFGWGEWFNAFERNNGQIQLDNRNALFGEQSRLTYSGIPFFISSEGYGFLLINSFRSTWTIKNEQMTIDADGAGADYIVIFGDSYKEILGTYTLLTGRPPLIPRWGFGLWVTGYPQENQQTAADYVEKHRIEGIPLDVVILDYHWEEHFHNFKWREKLIPHPNQLIADLKSRGIRLGLILTSYLNTHNRPLQKWLLNTFGNNVTPGLESDDERSLDEFNEAKKKGFLAHENVRWWFGKGGMIDFTNPGAVNWWQNKLSTLFEAGVAFIKNDDGEDLPDDAVTYNGMDGQENHNNYGFYYGKATYEIDLAQRLIATTLIGKNIKLRNIIYARSAWVGSQRYPALFMGDQEANFEGIRRGLRAGMNLAMSGFSYWTADVFGLSGKTTPETHMRYAQWALFSPVARYFFRPAVIDDTRYPWSHNKDVEDNFRKYTELRMRLLPYYNNLGIESYLTGVPIMRPLILEFEKDDRLRKIDDQIMLGQGLMICPVTSQGALKRRIVLPTGRWYDFWSDQYWEGPSEIEYDAPLNCLPLLVRSGSIIPMCKVMQNIPSGHQFEELELHIWPSCQAEYVFFEEDGFSTAYTVGGYSKSKILMNEETDKIVIKIFPVEGKFEGQKVHRELFLFLHNIDESKVKSISAGSVEIPYQSVNKSLIFSANCDIFNGIELIVYYTKGDDQ